MQKIFIFNELTVYIYVDDMLKENEVVMLVLGICVMILIFLNTDQIRKIRFWKIIFTSYCILLSAWLFTVLEEFFLPGFLNMLEHSCYFLSALLISVWAWKITGKKEKEGKI